MKEHQIYGKSAPAPRPTKLAAALVALACALPVGIALWIAEAIF